MRKPSASTALLMLAWRVRLRSGYRESGIECLPVREASPTVRRRRPRRPAPVSDTGARAVRSAAAAIVDQTTFWRALGRQHPRPSD